MLDFKKGRKLKKIKVDEVSLVGIPANRKAFHFWKDMEKTGELVCPSCGHKARKESHRGRIPRCLKCGTKMICAAKKTVEDKVMKDKDAIDILKDLGDEINDIDLGDEYESLIGEKMDNEQVEKADKLPAKVLNSIKGAFRMLNKYVDDLPDELKRAVKLMAKYTTGKYPYPKPYKKDEEGEDDLEKTGARVSKYTGAEIAKAVKILQELLPDELRKALEEEEEETTALELLGRIDQRLASLEKGKEETGEEDEEEEDDKNDKGSVEKTLESIGKRLETLEKVKGVKKGIEKDGDETGDTDEDPWTSIDI